ncbi:HAD family hydrolase [Petroclostridium sp. X23]|uniref:HAD family hydrolase n=1 Tax=Petroclostridium sp. X23 TaxID=3045146 RepID=UPI0024AE729C|nr:HAD family hydrolase [Petroclostridium sp. X23]WHH59481.1 HAD family hydrolase [Petroclostridium sp. X23]
MKNISWILFDCMETLVDLTELPGLKGYALWAYEGSGVEGLWDGFEDFYESYKYAIEVIANKLPQGKEYEVYERLQMVAGLKICNKDEQAVQKIADCLYKNFWDTYKSKCYVRNDVKEIITELTKKYNLGVVSNFMVSGGIEELLKTNGIYKYFDFIITSINEGWKKPHYNIYKAAIDKADVPLSKILFVGDDFKNDYITPKELGLRTVLLDRAEKYLHVKHRVTNFYMLRDLISY